MIPNRRNEPSWDVLYSVVEGSSGCIYQRSVKNAVSSLSVDDEIDSQNEAGRTRYGFPLDLRPKTGTIPDPTSDWRLKNHIGANLDARAPIDGAEQVVQSVQ